MIRTGHAVLVRAENALLDQRRADSLHIRAVFAFIGAKTRNARSSIFTALIDAKYAQSAKQRHCHVI
jgi:hypothetical protein